MYSVLYSSEKKEQLSLRVLIARCLFNVLLDLIMILFNVMKVTGIILLSMILCNYILSII